MTWHFLLTDLRAGGSERVSVTLARILRRRGMDVRFVCLGGGEGEIREWVTPEFELDVLGTRRTLTALPALMRLMRQRKGDAVMFSSREQVSLVALIAGRRLGIPVVVRLPNMPSNQLYRGFTGLKWRVIRWLNRRLLPHASLVIAQTDAMRSEAIDYYRLQPDRVATVFNPIDKATVVAAAEGRPSPFGSGGPQYVAVCNVSYAKGVDILLHAFRQVRSTLPSAHLTIVGRTGTDYAEALVASAGEGVTFTGFIANPYPYMRHCDVFVLPSRMEGFPNVVLEAMCFDKPVAATTCVPVIDKVVTPGTNGYTCPPGDAGALAGSMLAAARLTGIHNQYTLFDEEQLIHLLQPVTCAS